MKSGIFGKTKEGMFMSQIKTNDIFISYRRKGGEWLAYALYMRLKEDGYSVFLDKEKLRSGNYRDTIIDQIQKSNEVIVVLPPEALVPREQEDLFLDEIITAEQAGKTVIPVMMDGFQMPSLEVYAQIQKQDVYEKYIKPISSFNGCEIRGIMEFEGMILQLENFLLQSRPAYENISTLIELEDMTSLVLSHALILPQTGIPLNIFILGAKEYLRDDEKLLIYKERIKSLLEKTYIRCDGNDGIYLNPHMKEVLVRIIKPKASELLDYVDGFMNVFSVLREQWGNTLDSKGNLIKGHNDIKLLVKQQGIIGSWYESVYEYLDKKYVSLAASAACLYEHSDYEKCIAMSHEVLDRLLELLDDEAEQYTGDSFSAFHTLFSLWCPKAEESAWEEDCNYGNELYEDHSQEPEEVRKIYEKLALYLERELKKGKMERGY